MQTSYSQWKDKTVIADCFRELKQDEIAVKVIESEIIDQHLNILIKTANRLKRQDVLERLYFAGLIYG